MLRVLKLGVVLLAVVSAPAVAGNAKKDNCSDQADVLDRLIELRLSGTFEKKAVRILTEGEEALDEGLHFAVRQYASWIYGQPRRDAEKHDRDVFMQACLEQ